MGIRRSSVVVRPIAHVCVIADARLSPNPSESAYVGYEIIWKERGVVKRYLGTVDARDILQSTIDVEKSPRFDNLRYVINDFLGADSIDATGLDVDELAAIDRGAFATNPHVRIAVVTVSELVAQLTTQYVRSPVNVYETRLFSVLSDAEQWLGARVDRR